MGFVGTIFEAPKMPLHNVSYMTPFGTDNIFLVVDTITELEQKIPANGRGMVQVQPNLPGRGALDTYGILTNFPVSKVEDVKGHKIAAPGPSANWIKGAGAVPVAANLNTYYNGIKTGVFEGTLTFMTAAAAIKIHEVAPNICMVNFGAQFAGGLSINKDKFESSPRGPEDLIEVGKEYSKKLAKAQADRAYASMGKNENGRGQDRDAVRQAPPGMGRRAAQRAQELGQGHGRKGPARQ